MATSGDSAPLRTGTESADQPTDVSPPPAQPSGPLAAAAQDPDTRGGSIAERETSVDGDLGPREGEPADEHTPEQPAAAPARRAQPDVGAYPAAPPELPTPALGDDAWRHVSAEGDVADSPRPPVPGQRTASDRPEPPATGEPAVLPVPRPPADDGHRPTPDSARADTEPTDADATYGDSAYADPVCGERRAEPALVPELVVETAYATPAAAVTARRPDASADAARAAVSASAASTNGAGADGSDTRPADTPATDAHAPNADAATIDALADTVPLPPVTDTATPYDDDHAPAWPKTPTPEDRPLWAPRRPEGPAPAHQRPAFPEAPDHRRRRFTKLFRLPTPTDPAPAPTRLLVMCAWATGLGVLGMVVAVRGLVLILADAVPGWYEPALVGVLLTGMALTVGGFASMQRRWLPWIMLTLATVPLTAAVYLAV